MKSPAQINEYTVPELIVMLTYNDLTVSDAPEIFEQCISSKASCWGVKEHPLPVDKMKRLYQRMKQAGKKTFLEVVAYTEKEGLEGAKIAAECGANVLMGTKFFPSIAKVCLEHGVKYMPFVGDVTGRPSVLRGTVEEMEQEAEKCLAEGAYGIDLLGYRYADGNPHHLNCKIVEQTDAPVCLAGSIDSYERLGEVKLANPRYFTIGSAFFNHKFGVEISEQIDSVVEFMQKI